MRRWLQLLWLIPPAMAAVFWWWPPQGDDAYYHSAAAVEHVRAWDEGALLPRYHRGFNGGTGSFAPTIYSPIPLAIQGGLAWLVGDGQRAVGLSLALALLTAAALLVAVSRQQWGVVALVCPYVVAVALTRATTTEAWALVGAAVVLSLALPAGVASRHHGLALAGGVILVAGSQVGMLVQLGWLLAVAWLVGLIVAWRDGPQPLAKVFASGVRTFMWATAGLMTAGVLWLPTVLERHNLAVAELVKGPLDWRANFLPDVSELGLLLSATAAGLAGVAAVAAVLGREGRRWPLIAAVVTAIVLNLEVSAPLWRLTRMGFLQFPWRFLGPATIVAVLLLGTLSGRGRWLAAALLVLPSAVVPVRLDLAGSGGFPVSATPTELARLVQERWGMAPVLPSAQGFYAPGFHRLASLEELRRQAPRVETLERSVWGGTWQVISESPSSVMLPLQWWPEWRITAGERELPYESRSGLVAIRSVDGVVTAKARLLPSYSRRVGAALSLIGLVMLNGLAWCSGRGSSVRGAS